MRQGDLRLGQIYIVAGEGPLRFVGAMFPEPGKRIASRFEGHGPLRSTYWAFPEQVVRICTDEDLQAYHEQGQARGVACTDPECWCQESGLVHCRYCGHLTDPSDCGACGSVP